MKKIITLSILLLFISAIHAQQLVTQIKLSGFNVTLVPGLAFSYSYDEAKPTIEGLKGKQLTLKASDVKNETDRSSVTIHYVNIESLELENCELIFNSPLKLDKLTLKLDKASTVNLQTDIKLFNAEVKGASKLGLEGTAKNAKIKLEKASILNSYALVSEKFTLVASSASVSHVGVESKNIDINLASASTLTMTGKTKSFKGKATAASRIDATGTEIDKAEISTKGGSRIIVKAKELKSNTSN